MIQRLFFLVLCSVGLTNFALGFQAKEMTWHDEGYFDAELDVGRIYVELRTTVIYKLKGSIAGMGEFIDVHRLEKNSPITLESIRGSKIKDGFFTVGGKVYRVVVSCSSPDITCPDTLDGLFIFSKPGKYSIDLAVGDNKLSIPIRVEELPFAEDDPAAAVVEAFGEPKVANEFAVRWPDTKSIQGIIYSPTASESIIVGKHWTVEKLPGAFISIVDSKVYKVGSVRLRNFDRLYLADLKKRKGTLSHQ